MIFFWASGRYGVPTYEGYVNAEKETGMGLSVDRAEGDIYLEHTVEDQTTDNGQEEVRVRDGQVGEPEQTTCLQARDRKGRHIAEESEHADRDRELEHRNENLPLLEPNLPLHAKLFLPCHHHGCLVLVWAERRLPKFLNHGCVFRVPV